MIMNLQFASTTNGGVLSAREAFKNPELVLKHMTEEGATNKEIEVNIAVLSLEEYNQLCERDSIDLYLKQTEDAARFFLEKSKELFQPEFNNRFTFHHKAQLYL